ncbi:MAG: DNA cytosine methyltransferase [Acidobacteriaceae bacterium]
MNTMHLFAGAGGGLLADLILGHTPIVAVEWDKNACRVLRDRAADGWFPGLHVYEGDVRLFDPSEYAGRVDIIAAGFPCQDISAAGKGEGITGSRSGLVSEVFRSIDAVQPRYVFLENSPRIRTKGRHIVIGELVARGYAWRDGVLGAADVGAPHQRDRWFCLAANHDGMRQLQSQGSKRDEWGRSDYATKDATHPLRERCADSGGRSASKKSTHFRVASDLVTRERPGPCGASWFEAEPDVGRLVYGMADDLVPGAVKALGNGQVPLQAATAWMLLGWPV